MSEAKKNPRFEDDEWEVRHPDPEKVKCKDCFLREPDREVTEDCTIKGCILGICKVFTATNPKPYGILWNGESCPYYIDENEDDEE